MAKSNKSSNKLFGIDRVILLSVVGALIIGFMLGVQYKTTNAKLQNKVDWLEYTHEPFTNVEGWAEYPWSGFKLYYPSSWKLEVVNRDEATGELNIHASKTNGSYFDLLQGFGEGGRCLFPDESDYESFQGMGFQFSEYIEIDKSEKKWRLAMYKIPDTLWTHNLCEYKNGAYYSNNVIGIHKIKLTDKASIDEFVNMLEKLELLD